MSLIEAIAEAMDQIPAGRLVAGVTATVLLVQLRGLVLAIRAAGTPRARKWQVAGVAGALVATTVDVLAVHAARVSMLSGFAGDDASERASTLSAGISGQLNGIAMFASSGIWMLVLLGLQTVLEGRRPANRPAFYGALFLIPAGLAALVVGTLFWATGLIRMFATLAGVEPQTKATRILAGLDDGALALRRAAVASTWAILGLTALASVLIVMRLRRARSSAEPPSARPGWTATWWASAISLVLAAALWVGARPLRAENQAPWPALQPSGEVLAIATPPTPDLFGPDPIVRAPVVQLFADRLALDGAPYSLDDLGGPLQTLRMNYQLLHPGERFAGDLVVVADRALTMHRLVSLLRVAHGEHYDAVMFTFAKEETTLRPTMGALRRVLTSTARASLMDGYDREANGGADPEGDHTVLRAGDFASYDRFARRLVELRRADKDVVLDLGKDRDAAGGAPARP